MFSQNNLLMIIKLNHGINYRNLLTSNSYLAYENKQPKELRRRGNLITQTNTVSLVLKSAECK